MTTPIPNDDARPQAGAIVRLSGLVRRLVAPNPSPFTFTGTCSYVVGHGAVAVIDPGPDDSAHRAALLAATAGARIAHILVTHTHRDHSPGARALSEATGARIVGCAPHVPIVGDASGRLDASHDLAYAPDRVLRDGESLEGDGFTLQAVATPGHASNHLSFALPQEAALFSGDHVMAWSTTIVAPPDGEMRQYMASLDRLRARDERIYYPGHGGPVRDPARAVRALSVHRRQREASILEALDAGVATVQAIVDRAYGALDARLKGAAALSVLAHLIDLRARGLVAQEDEGAWLEARWRRA